MGKNMINNVKHICIEGFVNILRIENQLCS